MNTGNLWHLRYFDLIVHKLCEISVIPEKGLGWL